MGPESEDLERKLPYMIRMTETTARMLDRFKQEHCLRSRGDAVRALLEYFYFRRQVPECGEKKVRGVLI